MKTQAEDSLYIVVYDYREDVVVVVSALSVKECIVKVANYCGNANDLFLATMRGIDDQDVDLLIKAYNHFSNIEISAVFKISETLYEDEHFKKFKYAEAEG